MATAKRRKIVAEDLDIGTGTTDIPTDSGGSRVATKINLGTISGSADAVVQIDQIASKKGILLNGVGTHEVFKVYGSDRSANPADGKYLTMFKQGTSPAIMTNTYVTINGAIGDPVPVSIAGKGNYMLGIQSDLSVTDPTVLIKAAGPAIQAYETSDLLIFELHQTGTTHIVLTDPVDAGGARSALILDGSTSQPLEFNDSSQAADLKKFRITNNSQNLYFQAMNDARTSFTTAMSLSRAGGVAFYTLMYPSVDNGTPIGTSAFRFSDVNAVQATIGVGTNRVGDFYIGRDASATQYIDTASAAADPFLLFRRSRGTQASRANVQNADVYGTITAQAYSGATGFWDTADIKFYCDAVVTNNQRPPSAIQFRTNISNGAQTARWLMPSSGGLLTYEITDPSAPAADQVIIYARDNGGKTQLCARFPTGAVQQIAIEP